MNFFLRRIWQLPTKHRGKIRFYHTVWRNHLKVDTQTNLTHCSNTRYRCLWFEADAISWDDIKLWNVKEPHQSNNKKCRLLYCLHVVSFPIDLVLNTDAVTVKTNAKGKKYPWIFPVGRSHRISYTTPLDHCCVREIDKKCFYWKWKAVETLVSIRIGTYCIPVLQ